MAQILVSPLPTAEVTSLLLDLEAMLLKTGLGCLQHNCTSDPRMRDGIVTYQGPGLDRPHLLSSAYSRNKATWKQKTFPGISKIIRINPSFFDPLEYDCSRIYPQSFYASERIHKCIRRYQAHQTLVLLMVQSLATLQAFEQLL
ncbi:hypothetical protein BGZ93_010986 [Podila epicladia]|nr:hypothetical protein BGZ93_010986 [Podila epicladia]